MAFLLILYIKSTAEGNQSGGFNQEYYEASYKRGDKKAKVCASTRAAVDIWRPACLFCPALSRQLHLTRPLCLCAAATWQ